MLFPKVPRESLGGLWTALGSRTLLVNQTSHELFHRHSDLPGFTFEPGLVARIDIADGNARPQCCASSPVVRRSP